MLFCKELGAEGEVTKRGDETNWPDALFFSMAFSGLRAGEKLGEASVETNRLDAELFPFAFAGLEEAWQLAGEFEDAMVDLDDLGDLWNPGLNARALLGDCKDEVLVVVWLRKNEGLAIFVACAEEQTLGQDEDLGLTRRRFPRAKSAWRDADIHHGWRWRCWKALS